MIELFRVKVTERVYIFLLDDFLEDADFFFCPRYLGCKKSDQGLSPLTQQLSESSRASVNYQVFSKLDICVVPIQGQRRTNVM